MKIFPYSTMYSTQCTVVMHVLKRVSNFVFAFIVAAVAAEKALAPYLIHAVSLISPFLYIVSLGKNNLFIIHLVLPAS